MSKRYFLIALVAGFFIVIIAYILDFRAKKYYRVHSPSVDRMEIEAKELLELKSMFKDKKRLKRDLDILKRIKAPSKEYRKGGVYILEFEGLDSSSLKVMLRKILNSTLKLKVFRVVREKESGAAVHLEIER